MTLADAEQYYTRVMEAEKVLGPLTREEKMVILAQFGEDITQDELVLALQHKRVLIVKDKDEKTDNH